MYITHVHSRTAVLNMYMYNTIGSNCLGISGTVPDYSTLYLVPEGITTDHRSRLSGCNQRLMASSRILFGISHPMLDKHGMACGYRLLTTDMNTKLIVSKLTDS